MNFYDNINNLVASFKKTEEYLEYKKLKEELKTNEDTYKMLKDFKDKQNEVQIAYLNGQDVSKEKREEMIFIAAAKSAAAIFFGFLFKSAYCVKSAMPQQKYIYS